MRMSRSGALHWKLEPKSPVPSVNASGVALPHPDVVTATLPDGRGVRVWERNTPDVSALALARMIFTAGSDERWVTAVGVEVRDADGNLISRKTGLRGQRKFDDVAELYDEAVRQSTVAPAHMQPPAVPAVAARALPATPAAPAEVIAPEPQRHVAAMTMPAPPVPSHEPSYWQSERSELLEELAMWRRECMAARVALEEMRKLIQGSPQQAGSSRFFRREPPLTRKAP
jgi:hypothetical protein